MNNNTSETRRARNPAPAPMAAFRTRNTTPAPMAAFRTRNTTPAPTPAFRIGRAVALGTLALLSLLAAFGCTRSDRRAERKEASAGETVAIPTTTLADDGSPADGGSPTADIAARLVRNDSPPPGASREFRTDFSRSLIDFSEVISGGPPKDGIPAIRTPIFDSMSGADGWIGDNEMVFIVDGDRHGVDEIRIYPVQILIYHEIVNDVFGDIPIAVTYCPLCNSAVAFKGLVNGQALQFGVSGRLRLSNMIMYDDKTESWWQQATGKAIVGELVGTRLEIVPLLTVSWGEAKDLYDDARVLSRTTGHRRPYGRNPYTQYDTSSAPFLFRATPDPRHDPFARVIVGRADGMGKAFLYSDLQNNVVTHDTIGNTDVILFWAPESASPLDRSATDEGRIVGSANIFNARLGAETLTFAVRQGKIFDQRTGSEWNPLGVAIAGELKDQKLTALPSIQHFWFSYAAFAEEN